MDITKKKKTRVKLRVLFSNYPILFEIQHNTKVYQNAYLIFITLRRMCIILNHGCAYYAHLIFHEC